MPHLIRIPLPSPEDFDPAQTLDCGQAFRFSPAPEGAAASPQTWQGVAGERACRIVRRGGCIEVTCWCPGGCEARWRRYFDAGRDYGALKARLARDETLARAAAYAPGVRVLAQDPWEALCSFIISQNNNVARIKRIIRALCDRFGAPIPSWDAAGERAFPGAESLAGLSAEDLAPLRAGFRARYILDAARRVADRRLDLEAARTAPLGEARRMLTAVSGVGPKVAECALLYGLGRTECFPRDVWINRALERLYPGGFPEEFADVAGLAQQYLFHYCRTCPEALEPAAAR